MVQKKAKKKAVKERITINSLLDKKHNAHILKNKDCAKVLLTAFFVHNKKIIAKNIFTIKDIQQITGLDYYTCINIVNKLSVFGFIHYDTYKKVKFYRLEIISLPTWAIDLCYDTLENELIKNENTK